MGVEELPRDTESIFCQTLSEERQQEHAGTHTVRLDGPCSPSASSVSRARFGMVSRVADTSYWISKPTKSHLTL